MLFEILQCIQCSPPLCSISFHSQCKVLICGSNVIYTFVTGIVRIFCIDCRSTPHTVLLFVMLSIRLNITENNLRLMATSILMYKLIIGDENNSGTILSFDAVCVGSPVMKC